MTLHAMNTTDTSRADDRLKLGDLAPIIQEVNLPPHAIIAAARKVKTWGFPREEILETVYLAATLVEQKQGTGQDLDMLVDELHRLEDCAICSLQELLYQLRELVKETESHAAAV